MPASELASVAEGEIIVERRPRALTLTDRKSIEVMGFERQVDWPVPRAAVPATQVTVAWSPSVPQVCFSALTTTHALSNVKTCSILQKKLEDGLRPQRRRKCLGHFNDLL